MMNMNAEMKDKRGRLSGMIVIPFGAWAVLSPLLFGTDVAWEWNVNYFVLSVLPATAAVLGGLIMLSGRRLVSLGGLLALAGGLWFIAGPMTYPIWAGGLGTGPALGGSVWLAQWTPFFFGTGALIALLSSYALGFVTPLSDEAFEELAPVPPHERLAPIVREHAHGHRQARPAMQRARLHARR
jgi:hypothetical protein